MTSEEKRKLELAHIAEKEWLIARISEDLKEYGLQILWADGGGSACPTGWHRNPYVVRIGTPPREFRKSLWCRIGFHRVTGPYTFDGLSVGGHCVRCGRALLQDSFGLWFEKS